MDEKELTENEKKKEYLKSYRKALRREQRILDEIQCLRLDKMFPSIVQDGMPHGSSQEDLSGYAATLDEMIEDLKKERLEKVKIRKKIERSIRNLEDEDEQEVLRLKYINGWEWEDIAIEIGYGLRNTHYIHSRALKNLSIE